MKAFLGESFNLLESQLDKYIIFYITGSQLQNVAKQELNWKTVFSIQIKANFITRVFEQSILRFLRK